jgi:cytochrome P450
MPWDWRYRRNVARFRGQLLQMVRERRSGKSQALQEGDLLSILTTAEFFKGRDDLIIDEIITFFMAGMKTIQITSTNMIYYILKHPDIK